jgi:cell division protein ZapB
MGGPTYSAKDVFHPFQRPMNRIDFRELEARVDELIKLCDQLGKENDALQSDTGDWTSERARLVEKNELAKSKIEAMIGRLKALEQDG